MKVIINAKHGGFGLSDAAYERLAQLGVPVRRHKDEQRDPVTNLYVDEPDNEGEIIFDRELTPEGTDSFNDIYHKYKGKSRMQQRYWDTWTSSKRDHPLILKVVEEMGAAANAYCADLKIVEIPDGVEWQIDEYDGLEWVAEKHRTWS